MKEPRTRTGDQILQTGHCFSRGGLLFQITAWDPQNPLEVTACAAGTGVAQSFTVTELFAAEPLTRFAATPEELLAPHDAGTPTSVVDAGSLPAHLLKRADLIIQTVEHVQRELERAERQWRIDGVSGSATDVLRQVCEALPEPVGLTRYYLYRKLYRAHAGDRALIAAALRRKTFQKSRADTNTQHFADTLIQKFYRSNPPLRPETVFRIGQRLWEHNRHWWFNYAQAPKGDHQPLIERLLDVRHPIDELLADPALAPQLVTIQMPSRSWFYNYVNWFGAQPGEGAETYIARRGKADWEDNYLLFDRFVQEATLPLQFVCADHYRLDVLHVDDEFREVLSRLWLTVLIDAFSRSILGIRLAYEDPCIESIQGALRHAIWPKTHLTDFGIELPWTCYGIPQRLSLDNAWAHQSHSLEDLARSLSNAGQYTRMELLLRPPYQARYGALVERLFGNLAGQLRELLPGAVLKPEQRHWHNASQGACLLYRDVLRVLHQLVVTYMHTPHRELSDHTPHEQWLAGLQRMVPVPPPCTPHLERCFWRLYPETRTATRDGLALFGLHYWDMKLASLRSPDRQGRRRYFHLRYDTTDVSRVAVFESGLWLGDAFARELRLPDGRFEAVSLWELEFAKALQRQEAAKRPARPHEWLIYLLEARELIAQRQAEQKAIRRKVQALRESRPGRPAAFSPEEQAALEAAQWQTSQQNMAQPEAADADARVRLLETLHEEL